MAAPAPAPAPPAPAPAPEPTRLVGRSRVGVGLVVRGGVVYSPRNTCVFTCIQFEGWKSTEYTYSLGYPRVFDM